MEKGKEEVSKLFLDLDGVLANFGKAYERVFDCLPDRSFEPPGMWEKINQAQTFYLSMEPMPDAFELWEYVKRHSPTVLTGVPSSVRGAERQKREWVRKFLGSGVCVICCASRDKWKYGGSGDVLVDDWKKYANLWTDMGGVFVLHCSAKESVQRLRGLGF